MLARWGLGVAVLVSGSARAHAEPPAPADADLLLEAGLGAGPTILPETSALSWASASASVGAGVFLTRRIALSVRATAGYTSWSGWVPGEYDSGNFTSVRGAYGFVGPQVQLWIAPTFFVGLGGGAAWDYLSIGGPYASRSDLGLDVTLGTTVATLSSGAVDLYVEYLGPASLPIDTTCALSVMLGYRWQHARQQAAGAPPSVVPVVRDDPARRDARTKAWAYLDEATAAALRGDCATVETIGARVRDVDPEFYTTTFSVDPNVARCRQTTPP